MKPLHYQSSALQKALRLNSFPFAAVALFAGLALSGPSSSFGQAPSETLYDYGNFIDVGIGYVDIDGNDAAFLQRYGIENGAYGGIERFQYYEALANYTDLYISGHALYDNNDYALDIKAINTDIGFFEFGIKEYRTWYDGSGGYFPPNQGFFDLFDDALATDRGEIYLKFGLTFPDKPKFTFSYRRLTRDGLKSSTVHGSSNLTGGLGQRYYTPSFLDIDEERDIFEAKLESKIDKTDATFALRLENSEADNARKFTRNATEATDRKVTHRETTEVDLLNARFSSVTRYGEKTTFSTGVSYTEIDTNTQGSRIYGSTFDTVFDPTFQRQNRDHGFLNLLADSKVDQWVVNGNLMFLPKENLKAVIALRLEDLSSDTDSEFLDTNYSSRSGPSEEELAANASSSWNDYTASGELIYTGQENAVYTASLLYSSGDGDLFEQEVEVETGSIDLSRATDSDREVLKLALGAKYYPAKNLNYFLQYYHKERNNDYLDPIDSTDNSGSDRYPAFLRDQDFTVDDVNVRVSYRPLPGAMLVTRLDYQQSSIDTRGDLLQPIQSLDTETFIFSQIVSYATDEFYSQLSFNIVDDNFETPAANIGGNVGAMYPNVENDYWGLDFSTQFSLTKDSDIVANIFYLKADNFIDNSAASMPYGSSFMEKGGTVTLNKQLKEDMIFSLQYGYFENSDITSGGFNDFTASILYSKIRYRF